MGRRGTGYSSKGGASRVFGATGGTGRVDALPIPCNAQFPTSVPCWKMPSRMAIMASISCLLCKHSTKNAKRHFQNLAKLDGEGRRPPHALRQLTCRCQSPAGTCLAKSQLLRPFLFSFNRQEMNSAICDTKSARVLRGAGLQSLGRPFITCSQLLTEMPGPDSGLCCPIHGRRRPTGPRKYPGPGAQRRNG